MNEIQLEYSLINLCIVYCRMLQFEVELDWDRGVSHAASGWVHVLTSAQDVTGSRCTAGECCATSSPRYEHDDIIEEWEH